MKVCLLSDYNGIPDEGMRKIGFYLEKELSRNHEVLHLSLKPRSNIFQPDFWRKMKGFYPEVVHMVPGPTFKTFIFLKIIRHYLPGTRIIASAPNPAFWQHSKKMLPYLKPDIILPQSKIMHLIFSQMGFKSEILPNGVDINTYSPVSLKEKKELKKRYNLEDKFIILHVGPIEEGRNLQIFKKLQQITDVQVLIIASTSSVFDDAINDDLIKSGCLVWFKYFENIQEIYNLSDCYVFPTKENKNCVDLPLSVLEALSCNIPVVTTRFGGLFDFIPPGDGVYYVNNEDEFGKIIDHIIRSKPFINTKRKVESYSWENIASRLEGIYSELKN